MAYDSLLINGQIELMGGGHVASTNPQCLGAVFAMQPGYDLGAPNPISAIIASLLIDGERPIGQRSSNRTFTIPLMITGPTRAVVSAAREVLMQMINQASWPLIHTRGDRLGTGPNGTNQSTLFQCFRAQATKLVFDVRIENQQMATMTITFPGLPFGVSNQPVLLSFPGVQSSYVPPTTVEIEDFDTVGSPNNSYGWARNTTAGAFVTGTGAGRLPWTGSAGQYSNYICTPPGSPVDLSALTVLQHWIGFSASTGYPSYWQYFPSYSYVTVTYTLTDNMGRTMTFGTGLYASESSSTAAPNWYQLSVPMPAATGGFDYTHVATVQIRAANYGSGMLYADLWLDGVNAIPSTSQYSAPVGARSAYYTLTGIGSAHAPLAIQAAGAGTRTDTGCGTNTTTTVTDSHAVAVDRYKTITGTGIPLNATITAVSVGVGYTISAAATATAGSLTFTIGSATYPTLLLHTPGQYSPTTFQPVVSLCNSGTGLPTDTPDGTTEYSVVSPIAGQNARFAGTYSVVLAGYKWGNPTTARKVSVTIKQYAFIGDTNPVIVPAPGDPAPVLVRTFTPLTDLPGAGGTADFITIGEITLPNSLLTLENSQAYFTVTINSYEPTDRFLRPHLHR